MIEPVENKFKYLKDHHKGMLIDGNSVKSDDVLMTYVRQQLGLPLKLNAHLFDHVLEHLDCDQSFLVRVQIEYGAQINLESTKKADWCEFHTTKNEKRKC